MVANNITVTTIIADPSIRKLLVSAIRDLGRPSVKSGHSKAFLYELLTISCTMWLLYFLTPFFLFGFCTGWYCCWRAVTAVLRGNWLEVIASMVMSFFVGLHGNWSLLSMWLTLAKGAEVPVIRSLGLKKSINDGRQVWLLHASTSANNTRNTFGAFAGTSVAKNRSNSHQQSWCEDPF